MRFAPSGRPIVVAAHVVVVAVLIAFVYAYFLQPDDESTVSGVAAPGAPEVTQEVEPELDRDTGGDGTGGGVRVQVPGSVGAGTGDGPTAGPLPSSIGPPSGTTESPGSAPTGDQPTGDQPTGDQPSDDQYLDAVARLTVKVY